jgi:hypothetical protein
MNRLGRLEKLRHLRILIIGPESYTLNVQPSPAGTPAPTWRRRGVASGR